MNGDEFRDYILGFIFYKYLSENFYDYANHILEQDGISFIELDESIDKDSEIIGLVHESAAESLGYHLMPSQLFRVLVAKCKEDPEAFILDDLQKTFNSIEASSRGEESEEDFVNLFEDIDLTSTKLGKTPHHRNQLIKTIMIELSKIDFNLNNVEADVLGDSYEYLISNFASNAGKKAGEFYTPQSVSKILASIVTEGKSYLRDVYDPTSGSGSLLLRVAREAENTKGMTFYGQEQNRTTYNLARMNMILHGVHYRDFDLKNDDTLENPQHLGKKFQAIVANPPFSAEWSSDPLFLSDDRFSQYGKLAPPKKADYAFIQHMLHQLEDDGTMAVVVSHGVLFRGGAEGHIRKHIIEMMNALDAVIGLPENIFYGTGVPAAIMVFKKCRKHSDNILFVDASGEFTKGKNQNAITPEHAEKILSALAERKSVDKFAHVALMDEIKDNDYNLNIPRYVDTFEEEDTIDLNEVLQQEKEVNARLSEIEVQMQGFLKELGYE